MANTQAMCTSFKQDLLNGVHAFSAAFRPADTFKAALYLATATIDATTTIYSFTGEVSNSGTNYTQGGVAVTFGTAPHTTPSGTPTVSGSAMVTPSASIVYTGVTLASPFNAVLIYNSTNSNKAVSVHTFGSQTITAGTLTLTMPADVLGTALIEID